MSLTKRLLVLRAGSPSGNNLISSLKAGDPTLFIAGCHDDAFALKRSVADANYLMPELARPEFAEALSKVIATAGIDLVIPNTDGDVLAISRLSHRLACRTFLPSRGAIEHCQDKYNLTTFLHGHGIPTPETYAVRSLADIDEIFGRLCSHDWLWCRARKGTGSAAALPVQNPEQARAWMRYWEDVRGLPPGSFTLSEYLPGRDLMVQCLFQGGRPIIAKMFRRLTYHTLNGTPSGVSSTAIVSKMVFEPEIVKICVSAMLALEPGASCVFFADLKENEKGVACITEINAGRFSNMPTIHDRTARESMCLTYVRAALGEHFEARDPCGHAEDCYVMRERDTLPVVLKRSELFDGFEDAR